MIAIKLAHFGRADKLVRSALIFNPLILSGNRKKRGKAGRLPFLNRWFLLKIFLIVEYAVSLSSLSVII